MCRGCHFIRTKSAFSHISPFSFTFPPPKMKAKKKKKSESNIPFTYLSTLNLLYNFL